MIKNFGFDISYLRLVNDAANLCRWNPKEAMRWFDAARVRAFSPIAINSYNRAVLLACATLDSIEKSNYYNKEYHDGFWGEGVTPTRPTLIDFVPTMDEYLSMRLA